MPRLEDVLTSQMVNPSGVNISGQGYIRSAFNEAPKTVTPILVATLNGLKEKTNYVFGCGSWGGDSANVQLFDGKGQGLTGQRRNFSGFWWRQDVPNWTERALMVGGAEGVETASVVLSSRNQLSSWDGCYFVAKESIRLAKVADSLSLEIKHGNGEKTGPRSVVYLGEDRETRGNWIGNYGAYCWALCAMSAPRDMVGGEVTPLKCRSTALADTYNNEVVWTRGKGDFRYTSFTMNPADVLTRHWIGTMRTAEERVLENPQWGERTYGCWDDHGELHPTDGWGPDLVAVLRIPPGLWKLSLHFVDWDWHSAPFPRDHRIELSMPGDARACTARVMDFGEGTYKVFAVRGGKDLTVRLHKDRSAAVLISGIFLDSLTEPELHVAGVAVNEACTTELRKVTAAWKTGGEEGLFASVGIRALAERIEAEASSEEAKRDPGLQRLRGELWQHVPGAVSQARTAAEAYVASLVATIGAKRAVSQLQREADERFTAGAFGAAEWRYDAAQQLSLPEQKPEVAADACKSLALKFRIIHPLYAQRQIKACAKSLEGLAPEEKESYLRTMAAELFKTACGDWEKGRGVVRVPFALAESAYQALINATGYGNLTAEERTQLMQCCQRQTWYNLGWERLAAEQERLIETIPPEKVGGAMLNDLVRTYAVLAQNDPQYIEKAAKACEQMRTHRLDGDWTLDSYFRMVQIYYNRGMWTKAREACQAVIATWPDGPEGKEAKRLLDEMVDK